MKTCTICNRTYPDAATVCEHDGQRLVSVSHTDPTAAAPALDWDGPLVGDIIGSFRIEALIAEGGMGRIYKAEHLGLQRPVALKFLLPAHVERADLVQRFFNEARAVNAIRHPHIVDIFDFVQDVDAEGKTNVYMVMEYLEGHDARKRLQQDGPYHPDLLISVAVQVAETLAAAHDAGILHRDLKPDNIFLCSTGKRGNFVKLLDFGAAKGFGARQGHHLTRPGVAIGTPEYMSPEQIGARPMDGRVDAYGLGCVCYELLTGKLPFSAPKVAQILAMHTHEAPPPISQRRTIAPPVPPALEKVVLRCMEKQPDDRYPDLWAVAEAFQRCASVSTVAEQAAPVPEAPESVTTKVPALRDTDGAVDTDGAASEPNVRLPSTPDLMSLDAEHDSAMDWEPLPARQPSSHLSIIILLAVLALVGTGAALLYFNGGF